MISHMTVRPFEYVRLVIAGVIESTQSWSVGLNFSTISPPDFANLQAFTDAAVPLVHSWYTGGANNISAITSTDQFLQVVRGYLYPAGASTASIVSESSLVSPPNGAQAPVLSTREALCATLLTGLPGRSAKGRMYLPSAGGPLSNHQRASADVASVSAATADLISALNTAAALSNVGVACVAGNMGLLPITAVSVDSLQDTQRRREDKLAANNKTITPLP